MTKIFFFALLIIASFSFAQTPADDAQNTDPSQWSSLDAVLFETQLEDTLAHRFSDGLSLIIPRHQFQIYANVAVKDLEVMSQTTSPKRTSKFKDLPLDAQGVIQVERLLRHYEKQGGATLNFSKGRYLVKRVELYVGFDSNLSSDMKKSGEEWLRDRMTKEYGEFSKVYVSTLSYSNLINPQSTNSTNSGTNQVIQQVTDNHYLLSATIFFSCLMISSSIVWQRKQKRLKETAGMLVPIPEEQTSTNVELPIIPVEQDWKTMIMDLHLQGQDRTASLVAQWGQQGQEGIWKMATYFEITSPQFKSPAGFNELSSETKKNILKSVYLELFAHIKEHSNVA